MWHWGLPVLTRPELLFCRDSVGPIETGNEILPFLSSQPAALDLLLPGSEEKGKATREFPFLLHLDCICRKSLFSFTYLTFLQCAFLIISSNCLFAQRFKEKFKEPRELLFFASLTAPSNYVIHIVGYISFLYPAFWYPPAYIRKHGSRLVHSGFWWVWLGRWWQ